jgi:ligand-binding SRPBCC domain-containing protein
MPHIELTTIIAAPIEKVFDLARSIDAHAASQTSHGEKAGARRTSGLIEQGEEATWEAVDLGVRQRLTRRIVTMRRPTYFRDRMRRGAFQHMDHDHFFEPTPVGTVRKDVFDYGSPLGTLGRFADWLFLERYMRRLLAGRKQVLKQLAEASAP